MSQGSAFYMKSAPQTATLRSAPALHEQVNVLSMAVEASAAIILTATGPPGIEHQQFVICVAGDKPCLITR